MQSFLTKHEDAVTGALSCFDRVVFKGYLSIGWPKAFEQLITRQGLLIKDFGRFVKEHSNRVQKYAEALAQEMGRPYIYLKGRQRKDDLAREIATRDGIKEGLICVLRTLELSRTFKMVRSKGRPALASTKRKCLCIYYYLIHRELGPISVRIQTWFPCMVQVCLNGHEWLARKLDRQGIGYRRLGNTFLEIENVERAQRISDRFTRQNWPRILQTLARWVNPLLGDLLRGHTYYWVTDQAEYATDVMFRDLASLRDLYSKLLGHATWCFSAEDVLTFLGRKLTGNFRGEVLNDYKKRQPGARVKHRMKENWIKMYDKEGRVLRIETVINRPSEFKVRRRGKRQGKEVLGWFPMAKGVANLPRYMEVSRAANSRYLDALSAVDDPRRGYQDLQRVANPVRVNGRSHRGFNPVSPEHLHLFRCILRGEHLINGFRNRDIRERLLSNPRSRQDRRRQSARISRILKRLHVRGLIAKIPRSRRWRITAYGHATLSAAINLRDQLLQYQTLQEAA